MYSLLHVIFFLRTQKLNIIMLTFFNLLLILDHFLAGFVLSLSNSATCRFHLKLIKERLSWQRKQTIRKGWCVDLQASDFSIFPLNIIKIPLNDF